MITRFLPLIAVLGCVLGGCCQHGKMSASRPAATNSAGDRYRVATNRGSDPLAHEGIGTSAEIPDDPTVGRYPGAITWPITPIMGIGD